MDNERPGLQDSAQSALRPHAEASPAEAQDADGQPAVVAFVGALACGPDSEASADEQGVMAASDEAVRDIAPPSLVHVERLDAAYVVLALRVLIVLVALGAAVVHDQPVDVLKLLQLVAGFAP